MPHKGKPGTRQVTLDIDPDMRATLMRLTGAKTMTEAIHEALADLVLRERELGPLRVRRENERKWVAEKRLGLPSPEAGPEGEAK
jgi:Arc/MetJ family transcription regulator